MKPENRSLYPKLSVKRRLPFMDDEQVITITKLYYRFSLAHAHRRSRYHALYYQCYGEAVKRELIKAGDKP